MSQGHQHDLEQSWISNAGGWTDAVREGRLESRRLATDAAIVDAIGERAPRRVLDVGCGEGWLARALQRAHIDVVGVDAAPPLIEAARAAGGGSFLVRSYAELAADPVSVGSGFDAAVFNFSLFDEQPGPVLRAMQQVLAPTGRLYIQTVHPWTARGTAAYRDGWRTETFDGFGSGFPAPMPWFYRTLASWVSLLARNGFHVETVREPAHPQTGEPLSLLFAAVAA